MLHHLLVDCQAVLLCATSLSSCVILTFPPQDLVPCLLWPLYPKYSVHHFSPNVLINAFTFSPTLPLDFFLSHTWSCTNMWGDTQDKAECSNTIQSKQRKRCMTSKFSKQLMYMKFYLTSFEVMFFHMHPLFLTFTPLIALYVSDLSLNL